jgi:hypothetical protein
MNFELADKLTELLEAKKLDNAIDLAENELRKIPETDFHKIIGKDLKHMTNELKEFIQTFDKSTKEVLKKKQGFLKSILGTKSNLKPAAYYCEMNGFTINYDRWFIDLFSFDKFETGDWEWLSDFYDSTAKDLTITGFEEIQSVFRDIHENKRFEEPNIDKAYEVCELIVILRLQELFRETYKSCDSEWTKVPMFVTAHDYEMIYRTN